MALDIDTFLVALYTIVDDLYLRHIAQLKPNRPGQKPKMADSEVLTLAICAQWSAYSERGFVEYARRNWKQYFPRLVCRTSVNRRTRDLSGVLVKLIPLVADEMGAYLAHYQVLDGVSVPLEKRCRGQKHRLFAHEAAIGRGGSDKDWYYGCQLLLAVSEEGIITGFILGPANTEGHWLGEALLCWRANKAEGRPWEPKDLPASHRKGGGYVGPTGPIWPRDGVGSLSPVPYLADRGFRGRHWDEHWKRDYLAEVITAESCEGEGLEFYRRKLASFRQVIETVNGHLEGDLKLAFPGARTIWGLLTRVAAKLVAFNLGVWLNRLFGRADFAIATLFSF